MRLYKFYPAKWGREALQKKRLKITTGADINDPFELSAANLGEKSLRKAVRCWKDQMFSTVGIISFCIGWSNPVIWSHYAEAHKGLCLEFDVDDEDVVHVDYVRERLEVDPNKPSPPEGLGYCLFKTKFCRWSYESEKRVCFDLKSPSLIREKYPCSERDDEMLFAPFDPRLRLKEVIIGSFYEPYGVDDLEAQLLRDGVKIHTTRPAFKTFHVVKQKMPKLHKRL